MTGCLAILVSVLALHRSLACTNLEKPRWKSFYDVELECVDYLFITNGTLHRYHSSGYPNELSVRKLLNCIVVNLNAWDEDKQKVKDHVLSQFFIPTSADCRYQQHIQKCLDQNVAPLDNCDRLGRVYRTFQCYYQNNAGISEAKKWIPYHFGDIVQTVYNCMHIETLSPRSLLNFCQGRIASNPDYPTLAYCFFVRSGFYNELNGMDLDKLYVQFGSKPLLDDKTKLCVAEMTNQHCKEPSRIGKIILNCLVKYLPATVDIGTAASDALGNPPECVISANPAPTLNHTTTVCALSGNGNRSFYWLSKKLAYLKKKNLNKNN